MAISEIEKIKFNYPDVNVLIFKDNNESAYIAHAPEFDLVATGKAETKAKKNLIEAIAAQLKFAFEHEMIEAVLTDAPR